MTPDQRQSAPAMPTQSVTAAPAPSVTAAETASSVPRAAPKSTATAAMPSQRYPMSMSIASRSYPYAGMARRMPGKRKTPPRAFGAGRRMRYSYGCESASANPGLGCSAKSSVIKSAS
jgi:hypothetical protein